MMHQRIDQLHQRLNNLNHSLEQTLDDSDAQPFRPGFVGPTGISLNRPPVLDFHLPGLQPSAPFQQHTVQGAPVRGPPPGFHQPASAAPPDPFRQPPGAKTDPLTPFNRWQLNGSGLGSGSLQIVDDIPILPRKVGLIEGQGQGQRPHQPTVQTEVRYFTSTPGGSHSGNVSPPSEPKESRPDPNGKLKECFVCKEMGHKQKDCPYMCYLCNEMGHRGRDCPQKCKMQPQSP